MAKAAICPVCNGTGKVTKTTAGGTFEVDCHGCGGRGWVEVADGIYPMNPYPTYIPPVYPYYDPNYSITPWYPDIGCCKEYYD